jgi:hypothetical protein
LLPFGSEPFVFSSADWKRAPSLTNPKGLNWSLSRSQEPDTGSYRKPAEPTPRPSALHIYLRHKPFFHLGLGVANGIHSSCYIPRPFHPLWLDHPNSIWWRIQIMKLHLMEFSPFSCHFLPLRPKYSLQCPVLKGPHSMFFPLGERHNFTPMPYRKQHRPIGLNLVFGLLCFRTKGLSWDLYVSTSSFELDDQLLRHVVWRLYHYWPPQTHTFQFPVLSYSIAYRTCELLRWDWCWCYITQSPEMMKAYGWKEVFEKRRDLL